MVIVIGLYPIVTSFCYVPYVALVRKFGNSLRVLRLAGHDSSRVELSHVVLSADGQQHLSCS